MKKLLLLTFSGNLVFLAPLSGHAVVPNEEVSVFLRSYSQGEIEVKAELADSPAEREQGLMFRKELPADKGMLFLWREPQHNVFWMKNTEIPLDIIFVNGDKIVAIIPGAQPMDESPLDPGVDSDKVLEMNAGWTMRHEVYVGSPFRMESPY